MSKGEIKKLTEKHPGKSPDSNIKAEFQKENISTELPCTVAFEIATRLNVSPAEVGMTSDLLNIKISKCQMGLFGHQPMHKLVSTEKAPSPALRDALSASQTNNRITCKIAWETAARLKVGKIAVGNACEAMGIKVKQCQIGAF
jgi:hypothetical protein